MRGVGLLGSRREYERSGLGTISVELELRIGPQYAKICYFTYRQSVVFIESIKAREIMPGEPLGRGA